MATALLSRAAARPWLRYVGFGKAVPPPSPRAPAKRRRRGKVSFRPPRRPSPPKPLPVECLSWIPSARLGAVIVEVSKQLKRPPEALFKKILSRRQLYARDLAMAVAMQFTGLSDAEIARQFGVKLYVLDNAHERLMECGKKKNNRVALDKRRLRISVEALMIRLPSEGWHRPRPATADWAANDFGFGDRWAHLRPKRHAF